MNDKQPKPRRITPKERQAVKEQRAIELAATIANIPKYVPQTAKESQEERDRYKDAIAFFGKEIERLETIKTLNNLYQT